MLSKPPTYHLQMIYIFMILIGGSLLSRTELNENEIKQSLTRRKRTLVWKSGNEKWQVMIIK